MEVEGLIQEKLSGPSSDEEADAAQPKSSYAAMFADFEKKFLPKEPVPKRAKTDLEARHRAEIQMNDYLKDARIALDDNPFDYWRVNGRKWPELAHLVQKYHSAPAGSVESERLFSTAGATITHLRKSLLADNVEKLLFVHHNLPIFHYEY